MTEPVEPPLQIILPGKESKICQKCSLFKLCDSPFQKGAYLAEDKIKRGVPKHQPEGGWIVVLGDYPSVVFDETGKMASSAEFLAVAGIFSEQSQEHRLFYVPSLLCRPYEEDNNPDSQDERKLTKPSKSALKRCQEKHIGPIIAHLDPKAIISMGPTATNLTHKRLDYFALVGRSFRYGPKDIPAYAMWHLDHTGIDPKKLTPKFEALLAQTIVDVDTMKVAKIDEVSNQGYTLGITAKLCREWFQKVYDHPKRLPLGWDVETTGLEIYRGGFKVGIFSFDHPAQPDNPLIVITEYTFAEQIYKREVPNAKRSWDEEKKRIEKVLQIVLEDEEIPKIGHNLQYDECAVRQYYKWDVKGFYADTMLLNYMLNPDETGFGGLESLVRRYLPDVPEYWTILDQYKEEYQRINGVPHTGNYLEIPEDIILPYAAFDTVVVTKVYRKLLKIFKDHDREKTRGGFFVVNQDEGAPVQETYSLLNYAFFVRSIHHKLCAHLRHVGQNVDHGLTEKVFKIYDADRILLKETLQKDPDLIKFEEVALETYVGKSSDQRKALKRGEKISINWASVKQVRGFFIDYLRMPVLKRTEKGAPCLDEAVIEQYANTEWYTLSDGSRHLNSKKGGEKWLCTPAKHLAKLRKDEKFITSFLNPILEGRCIHSDGLMHTEFKPARVATGRLAATNPPVQAIPRDGLVKKLYGSRYPNGWMLTRDYSGLEVRILALFCRDPLLVRTFQEGGDVHFNTQKHFFGKNANKSNKTQRSICKQALFGNIFGQGDKGLFELLSGERIISPETGLPVSMEECKRFNQMIYELYPKVGEWVQFAHTSGIQEKWVASAFGFVRGLPELESYRHYQESKQTMSWDERKADRFQAQLGAMVSGALRRAQNCCDELTEALTKTGWKKYNELSLKDELLTKNQHTGELEWHRPTKICVFESSSTPVALVETNTFSACVTPNHRWLVTKKVGRAKKKVVDIATMEEVIKSHGQFAIHRTGEYKKPDSELSDLTLKLIGWYVTDSSIAGGKDGRQKTIVIGQSLSKLNNCQHIRETFNGLFVSETEESGFLRWRINIETSEPVIKMLPDRKLTYDFVFSLSKRQAVVLLSEIARGDGSFSQKEGHSLKGCVYVEDAEEAGVLQALYFVAGVATNSHDRDLRPYGPRKSKKLKKPIMSTKPSWFVTPLVRTTAQVLPSQVEWIDDGRLVWCPQVPNQTFVARRKGCVYVTGNTSIQSTASDITVLSAWRTNEKLIEGGLGSRVISVIHDDIWIDVPHRDEMVEANRILAYTMDNFKEWIPEMLPGFDSEWAGLVPVIGECEIGLNPKDALKTLEEPKNDGTGNLVLSGGQNEDGSQIALDWNKDYDQIRETCFLKKLKLDK